MATATKTSKAMKTITAATKESRELFEAAEELAAQLADEKWVDPESFAIFDRIGWDKEQIERQIARIRAVRGQLPRAGTLEQIAELQEAAELAKTNAAGEIEQLRTAIAEGENQIRQHEADVKAAQAKVDEMSRARDGIRAKAPQFVKDHYIRRRASIDSALRPRLAPVESRLKLIDDVISSPTKRLLNHLAGLPKGHYARAVYSGRLGDAGTGGLYVKEDNVKRYREELKAERPKVEAELKPLQDEYAAAMAECESLLDYYLRD